MHCHALRTILAITFLLVHVSHAAGPKGDDSSAPRKSPDIDRTSRILYHAMNAANAGATSVFGAKILSEASSGEITPTEAAAWGLAAGTAAVTNAVITHRVSKHVQSLATQHAKKSVGGHHSKPSTLRPTERDGPVVPPHEVHIDIDRLTKAKGLQHHHSTS